jgi:thiamine pyrophosphokinase
MNALILADGEAPDREALDLAWPGWDEGIGLVVAADGGARHAARLGVDIDVWVGDGDSLDAAGMATLVAGDVPMEHASPHKDESDTELAIRAALDRGADGVIMVGALGGARIDHALANIGLLGMPELAGRVATMLDAGSRIRMIQAPAADGSTSQLSLAGRAGDLVSLLPVGADVEGVTTRGLAYPLADEPLPVGRARGLSNVRIEQDASVEVRKGMLLVAETPATLAE